MVHRALRSNDASQSNEALQNLISIVGYEELREIGYWAQSYEAVYQKISLSKLYTPHDSLVGNPRLFAE